MPERVGGLTMTKKGAVAVRTAAVKRRTGFETVDAWIKDVDGTPVRVASHGSLTSKSVTIDRTVAESAGTYHLL